MKAAFVRQTGSPSVIEYGDLPDPECGPTECVVKVGAASVNPIDTYIRAGNVSMINHFPYIVGCDLAGEVVECGSQVTRFKPGDRVWGSNQGLFGRQGATSELAAVDERWLYPTPAGQSDQDAAAGALVGLTAYLGLFLHGNLQAGEVVFVNGGAGGVGSAVIQLAHAAGARVIATAGSEENLEICRQLGADLAVNYHDSQKDDQIRAYAMPHGGVQLWFETQREPTLDRTVTHMAPRGRIILMAGRAARPEFPVGPFYVKDLRILGFAMFNGTPEEQQTAATALNSRYAEGKWRAQIGKVFRMAETAAAHQLQEEKTLQKLAKLHGKIVIVP